MKTRFGTQFVCFALFLGVALVGSPVMVGGASGVEIGVQNLVDKVECVGSFLRQEKNMIVSPDFAVELGITDKILDRAKPKGDFKGTILCWEEDENLAENAKICEVAQELLDEGASGQDRDLLDAIVLALCGEERDYPEGYCEPEAYEGYRPVFDFETRFDDTEDDEKRTTVTGNFIYYGREYKLLPTKDGSNLTDDVYTMGNGILSVSEPFHYESDSSHSPIIEPLALLQPNSPPADAMAPPVESTTDSGTFQRFAYGTVSSPLPPTGGPFSATLFMNENSEQSDTIIFAYGDVSLPPGYEAFVGLIPGDGSVGHPGRDEERGVADRGGADVDLSKEYGQPFDGDEYLEIGELFDAGSRPGYGGFDLANSFLVFKADGDNKYTVTTGHRSMVVDSLGLDGNPTILDTVVQNEWNDPAVANAIETGEFKPGDFLGYGGWTGYEYGTQNVGTDYGSPRLFSYQLVDGDYGVDRLNDSGFLAYAVQFEEDVLNKEILRMYAQNAAQAALAGRDDFQAIRDRDAELVQLADAQSGRVTRDSQGNWVRAQQYILRPDDNTVKVLNVSFRGGDAGNLSGLSTMDFTTSLKTGWSEDLRELPWNDWLNTKNGEGEGVYRYVESPTGFPELNSMSVVFKNPQKESLKEFRTFNGRPQFREVIIPTQEIDVEQLTLNSGTPYDFEDIPTWDSNYDSWFPGVGSYTVRSHSAGFDYRLGDGTSIDVAFYALGDGENAGDLSNSPAGGDINDIWDALRVNEGGTSPDIGSNVLEIAIDQNADYFEKPIDVVYIPMSRMLWKDSGESQPM